MHQPKYLPFADGQWRLKSGLTALDLREWIEIDDRFADDLTLRAQLLKDRYPEVFASLDGSEAAQQEVLELLIEHLLTHFPQHYRRREQKLENLVTGQSWDPTDFSAAPLDLAGRLVQEDLCLMQPGSEGYILTAASLCFPSHWLLRQKLGRPMAQIHQPVPGYREQLERPLDRFFAQLKSDKPVWRVNWSIVDTPELFLAQSRSPKATHPILNVSNAGEQLWLRTERQTLRRLAQSQAILFTIRTYVCPLSFLEARPALAHSLAQAVQHMPPDMQRYKSILPIRDALLGYLSQVSTSPI